MEFALANLKTDVGDRAAIVIPSGFYRLDRVVTTRYRVSLRELMNDWVATYPRLVECARQFEKQGPQSPAFVAPEAVELKAPLCYPNKLVCVGGVYRDHLREFNLPAERWPKMPIFLRPPTTSIVGPGSNVPIPPGTSQFDWEIELAVVVGQRLTDGDLDSARAAIAGYSIGIDLTCRDLLARSEAGVDLIRAKAQDAMAPLGPTLVPAPFVGDPQNLRMRLFVNDEIKQDGCTSEMLYSVYEQLATISRITTLEPGDVVFTGSCAGSGASIGQFLQPGDRIRAEIDKIGTLNVNIVETRTRPAGYREELV